MKYTVVWSPEAKQSLAAVSARAVDQAAIADSADVLDYELRHYPAIVGELQPDGRRIGDFLLVQAEFRISEDDHIVTVLAAARSGQCDE